MEFFCGHDLKKERLKNTNPNFEMPMIKIVDFTSTQSCVFRFFYSLLSRRNSEVKKMSSDSEWNSFTSSFRSSDKDLTTKYVSTQ